MIINHIASGYKIELARILVWLLFEVSLSGRKFSVFQNSVNEIVFESERKMAIL